MFRKKFKTMLTWNKKKIDDGVNKVIGVNIFTSKEKQKISTFKHDKDAEHKIIASLYELKKNRDNRLVQENLNKLKRVAQSSENVMPIMIEAVKSYATIEEICNILRQVFGEYQNPQIF